tara:strand:- start:325 stop:486 length:162 start_codon:yes stop_codon:yes gene_type:complete
MNEFWIEELVGPRKYGESMYSNSYFGSAEFEEETTETTTWVAVVTNEQNWTEV